MAIYHCSVKPVQRSTGRSATAAAAYRAGERVKDERTGEVHDYRKKAGIEHTEIIGFDGTRADLWNAAEAAERRKDATVAREYEVALPAELDLDQRRDLCREFGGWLHERHGCAVDVALHRPDPHDHGQENPHAHILTTTRAVTDDGTLGDKCAREWSDTKRKAAGLEGRKDDLEEAREKWAECCNAALERAGSAARVDHRSLEDQGIEREPTKHLGPTATAMERRGAESDRGDENREIEARNELRDVNAELAAINEENRLRSEKWRLQRDKEATPTPAKDAGAIKPDGRLDVAKAAEHFQQRASFGQAAEAERSRADREKDDDERMR